MKKWTAFCITLAVAAIAALCALAGYLTIRYRDPQPASDTAAESEAEAAILALHEAPPEAPAPEPETDGKTVSPIIWVGDSRTLGMQEALENSDLYIAAAGEGYNWFVETGLAEMEAAVKEHPDAPVVLNFGVNDYDNMDKYMELYQTMTAEHPDTQFYFLSVNPIDPEVCTNITNEEIADFNSHLRALFPDTYLDSYTMIKASEIVPFDGIHYTKDDYRQIYEYAVGQIARRQPDAAA